MRWWLWALVPVLCCACAGCVWLGKGGAEMTMGRPVWQRSTFFRMFVAVPLQLDLEFGLG